MEETTEHRSGDSFRAVATLANSTRFRTYAIYIATAVIPAAASWAGAKLDTQLEMDALTHAHSESVGKIAALESRQADLEKAIIALTAPVSENFPGGAITQLRVEVRYAHRGVVKASVLALAYEKDKDRQKKRAAVKDFVDAFDRKTIKEGDRPRDAVESVFNEIAVP